MGVKKADFHRLKVQPGTRRVSSEGLPAVTNKNILWHSVFRFVQVFLLSEHVCFCCNPRIGISREMAKACAGWETGLGICSGLRFFSHAPKLGALSRAQS